MNKPANPLSLLVVRPMTYFLWEWGEASFVQKLDLMVKDLLHSDSVFRYETKRMLYCEYFRNIVYFQSNLKYVRIQLQGRQNRKHFSFGRGLVFCVLRAYTCPEVGRMIQMLMIESGVRGLLTVNGQFCGPVDGEGQAFPAGQSTEIYMQLFPFVESAAPLTAELRLREGRIERLEPRTRCFALVWPDGVIQLELRPQTQQEEKPAEAQHAVSGTLLRYLTMRLADDPQAQMLWMRPQDEAQAPDLSGYHAAVPLRFAPLAASERFDERAGLVRRTADNVAQVDAALAITSPAGQGRRLIERMEILPALP